LEQGQNGQKKQEGRDEMDGKVDQMISKRIILPEIPVQGEGQAGDRAVYFVFEYRPRSKEA
jgi:hypothetical protein